MQVVIPIAGKGTRMARHYRGPKQLLPVAGKPLVEHTLAALPPEIDELVLVVGGPYEQQIRDYFGQKHKGRRVVYVRQEKQLGLGHAIQQARGVARGKFLQIVPDDIYAAQDLKRLLCCADLGALVKRVENPQNYGVLVTDEEGHIVEAVEKPTKPVSDLVSIGAFLLDEEFFQVQVAPSARGEYELPDIVMALVKERGRKVKTVPASWWLPVNDPAQLSRAEEEMLRRLSSGGASG
jgi:dTDP-glucose pyrophosphorylase